jgi:peptide/nickel transport system permease protein
MSRYVLRRLVLLVPTLALVTLLVFSIIRLLPGDIVTLMMSEQGYASDKAKLEQMMGLDQPFYRQYVTYVGRVLQGDLGVSFWTKEPVLDEILRRLPVSLELALLAMVFGLLIAVPTGIFSAVRQDTWLDYLFRTGAIGGLSVPGFWMATVVIVAASIWWQWVPPMRYTPFARDPVKNLSQLVLPAIILGLALSARVMRMTRSMVLEVLREDYVRTAWAKGAPGRRVVVHHLLRNSMLPVVTLLGLNIAYVFAAPFGGALFVEEVFNLHGLGAELVTATTRGDIPVVVGVIVVVTLVVIVCNFLVDVAYAFLDPRIRLN